MDKEYYLKGLEDAAICVSKAAQASKHIQYSQTMPIVWDAWALYWKARKDSK